MSFKDIIFVMAIYTLAQYAFSRFVAYRLSKYDKNYFKGLDFSWGSMRVSFGITRMIFDAELPPENYSVEMKRLILAARTVYAATIPLLVVLLIF
ncbi:hypothetical protein KK141_19160 [Dyella sp. LX-66]|uniref:hypothetical protein n=1 Tax=unclassified Dyella TaxID=2634549 RepID=UPI001BE04F50|nr:MULTISPECIES: hypothetical protein [unclassified Dyella]MBT2119304.1 hypothetical protein [Dyella sp. LX-1]MBT2141675.1 hypothetical protein [Dyella sp. LX-66]